ncbi:MAG: hypothetical protein GY906_11375 [bacterium]|nr:hypothetical protein [bacterium]
MGRQPDHKIDLTPEEKVRNRNSWLKVGVITVVTVLLAWKLSTASIPVDLTAFEYSDLTNLLLAFFAIGLSVAFYFRATETSNRFYDNSYSFTRDMSEILGRIEAGFGERLKHLDEGYSGLRDRFDSFPFDKTEAQHDIQEGEQTVKKVEEERTELLEKLMLRAQVQDEEKMQLFDQIKRQDKELEDSRHELTILREQMKEAERAERQTSRRLPTRIVRYFRTQIMPRIEWKSGMTIEEIRYRAEEAIGNSPPAFIEDSTEYRLLDDDDKLTVMGFELLKELLTIENR